MKKLILFPVLFAILFSASSQAESENFKLYLQGKVVESIEMMNQELWRKQFTVRELNRMISRLNSAYETNLGVDTELYVKALDKIRKQKAAPAMEMDANLLRREVTSIITTNISVSQVENLLRMTDMRSTGNSRSLRFLVLKMVAYRIHKRTGNMKALYLAGLAGDHRFNTGTQYLSDFVELCQLRTKDKACSDHLKDALQRLNLSEQLKLGN